LAFSQTRPSLATRGCPWCRSSTVSRLSKP
jgi:hypothetical protein